MAEAVQEIDLTLLIEKEIIASHRKELLILNALDTSYGFDYPSKHGKKRPHNGFTDFVNSGAKTKDSNLESYEVKEKRLCLNSHLSKQHRSDHET